MRFLLEPAEMIERVWAEKKPTGGSLKELAELAQEHRVELLEQWEQIHKN